MKRLSSKEVYEILTRIEQDFDTSLLLYRKTPVWPIVRAILAQQLLAYEIGSPIKYQELNFNNNLFARAKAYLKHLVSMIRVRKQVNSAQLNLAKCTYIARVDEMKDQFGESIIGKGFVNLVGSISEAKVLSLQHPVLESLFKKTSRYYLETLNLSHIKGIIELKSFLEEEYSSVSFNYQQILHSLAKVWSYKDVFLEIFRSSQCEFVFFSVFFHPISFAISMAANTLNMNTIEIQHGQQGKYSPLNLGMKNSRSSDFVMLPKLFWAWGEKSKKLKIERGGFVEDNIIVAGSPTYFLQFKDNDHKAEGMLIALQKLEPLLPQFVFDFIKEYPSRVVVRLHPHMNDLLETIKGSFCDYKNVEVQGAYESDLYEQIQSVQLVLTNYSSVVVEAASLGKVGIVVHGNAFDLMEDYISNKEIFKANNIEDLRGFASLKRVSETNFLETDVEVAQNRLNILVNNTGNTSRT